MNKNMQKMNCKTAKNVPLNQIMAGLKIPIEKAIGSDIWYLSPFKLEKTASFKINTKRNIWYDFSLGQGGDGINLIQTLKNCDTKLALEYLSEIMEGNFFFQKPEIIKSEMQKSSLKILNINPISDKKLIQYLNSRGIFNDQAISFCQQIEYENMGKKFKSIAFQNLSGGYEIRSEGFKSCQGKKDISLLKNDAQNLLIFEGFFDFFPTSKTQS